MRTIVFTGGGSSGHVNPNIPLIEEFQNEGWRAAYLGSDKGPERLICAHHGLEEFYSISTERFRRFWAWSNFAIPIKVVIGIFQAFFVLGWLKPRLVFSKGGFVSVPVVIAAWLRRIRVISHESDLTPGLATRVNTIFSTKVFLTLPSEFYAQKWLKTINYVCTGIAVRDEFTKLEGSVLPVKATGKKILLIFGGSSGARAINQSVRSILGELLLRYQVVHIVGPRNIDPTLQSNEGYTQIEYLTTGMGMLIKCADAIICRAGMTSLVELIFFRKAAILVPLSKSASRGDQIENARVFEEKGCHLVIDEEDLDGHRLLRALEEYQLQKDNLEKNIEKLAINFDASKIRQEIIKCMS